MSKQSEMEDIYQSFEWLLQEKLEQLDANARVMFSEMSVAGIPQDRYIPFVQQKIRELAQSIIKKEDELYVKKHNQLRRSKKQY